MEQRRMRQLLRIAILMLAFTMLMPALIACAAKTDKDSGKGSPGIRDNSAGAAIDWSGDSDCGICHSTESHSFEDRATAAFFHTSKKCTDCHDEVTKLEAMHEGVTTADFAPKRLKQTAVKEETCVACHDQAQLVQATADVKVLTDSEGKTVNPHQVPETASGAHEAIVCASCHELHNDTSGLTKGAKDYCLSCHHANVFTCNTCHGEK